MNPLSENRKEDDDIERAAASWTLKIDRGLSAKEQDAYSDWLAEDVRHREAIALCNWGWGEFDRLAGLQTTHQAHVDPDLLAPGNRFAKRPRLLTYLFTAIPAAAVFALVFFLVWPDGGAEETEFATKPAVELIARIDVQRLEDGSKVEVNRGSVLEVNYTPTERRLRLVSGEAHFTVAKDRERPFIVEVDGVQVRALGTQFNVRIADDSVDVIVTEGVVDLATREPGSSAMKQSEEPKLRVGDRAIVALAGDQPIRLTKLTEVQIERELGWKPRLLDFDDAPLQSIIEEFNKRNKVKIVLSDSSLEELRLSSAFWSDNVEGFVRLMESSFGMSAYWRGSSRIELRKSEGSELDE